MFNDNSCATTDSELFGELEPDRVSNADISERDTQTQDEGVLDELDALIDEQYVCQDEPDFAETQFPLSARSEVDDKLAERHSTTSLASSERNSAAQSELLTKSAFEDGLTFVPSSSSLSQLSAQSPRVDPSPPAVEKEDLTVQSMGELFARFWELSFKLFFNVVSAESSCRDCLSIIEDIIVMVHRWGQLRSPVLVVALDVVVQRAMYELSDKVRRSSALPWPANTAAAPRDAVENIEDCVSLMTHLALPLCWQVQSDFHCNFLTEGTQSLGAKTQTLNRQLQELVGWTSIAGQTRAPPTFSAALLPPPMGEGDALGGALAGAQTGALCGDSPRSAAALELLDHALLSLLLEHGPPAGAPLGATPSPGAATLSREFVVSVQHTLLQIAARQLVVSPQDPQGEAAQGDAHGVQEVGAAALDLLSSALPLSLGGAESAPELDLALLSPALLQSALQSPRRETDADSHSLPLSLAETDSASPREREKDRERERRAAAAALRLCECAAAQEVRAEAAAKHLRACAKDFVSLSLDVHAAVRAHLAQHAAPGGAHSHYYGVLCGAVEEDAEHLRRLAENVLEHVESSKLARIRANGALPQVLSRLDLLGDVLDRPDRDKNACSRRVAKALEKPVRDAGFAQVRCVTTRARFVYLSFVAYDARARSNVSCTLFVENELPVQGTLLLREYLRRDPCGTLRAFLCVVKRFAAAHKIDDPASGFLSPFAWQVMALHVLLRCELMPSLHGDGLRALCEDAPCVRERAVRFAAARLHGASLLQLLDAFFRYFVERFDAFTDVVSLREDALVLRKADWQKSAVLWRLSIEDPFAPQSQRNGFDLGSTLSRPGQLTTFKAMRRAVYGIRSIVAMGMDSTRLNMKKFFSRSELIHLARRSDYVGAAMLPARSWARREPCAALPGLRSLSQPLSAQQLQAIAALRLEDAPPLLSPRALSLSLSQSQPGTARDRDREREDFLSLSVPSTARSQYSTLSAVSAEQGSLTARTSLAPSSASLGTPLGAAAARAPPFFPQNSGSSSNSGAMEGVLSAQGEGRAFPVATAAKRPEVPRIPLLALHDDKTQSQSQSQGLPQSLSLSLGLSLGGAGGGERESAKRSPASSARREDSSSAWTARSTPHGAWSAADALLSLSLSRESSAPSTARSQAAVEPLSVPLSLSHSQHGARLALSGRDSDSMSAWDRERDRDEFAESGALYGGAERASQLSYQNPYSSYHAHSHTHSLPHSLSHTHTHIQAQNPRSPRYAAQQTQHLQQMQQSRFAPYERERERERADWSPSLSPSPSLSLSQGLGLSLGYGGGGQGQGHGQYHHSHSQSQSLPVPPQYGQGQYGQYSHAQGGGQGQGQGHGHYGGQQSHGGLGFGNGYGNGYGGQGQGQGAGKRLGAAAPPFAPPYALQQQQQSREYGAYGRHREREPHRENPQSGPQWPSNSRFY